MICIKLKKTVEVGRKKKSFFRCTFPHLKLQQKLWAGHRRTIVFCFFASGFQCVAELVSNHVSKYQVQTPKIGRDIAILSRSGPLARPIFPSFYRVLQREEYVFCLTPRSHSRRDSCIFPSTQFLTVDADTARETDTWYLVHNTHAIGPRQRSASLVPRDPPEHPDCTTPAHIAAAFRQESAPVSFGSHAQSIDPNRCGFQRWKACSSTVLSRLVPDAGLRQLSASH